MVAGNMIEVQPTLETPESQQLCIGGQQEPRAVGHTGLEAGGEVKVGQDKVSH